MLVNSVALLQYTRCVLRAWGMPETDAELTARLLVETDLRAIDSHGVSMLAMYEGMVQKGSLNMQAQRRIERDTPVVALIDADAGLGHPVAYEAMTLACDKAIACGLGAVGVHNSHHFGAAGLYAELASQRGLLGLVTSSARTVAVLPTHGATPMLGTNPIAFAAPALRHPAVLLDMATSTVALNKVKVHALNKLPIPAGWVVDGKGDMVLDAQRAFELCKKQLDGGLLPLGGVSDTGGHKGYGLALLAQLLGSTLVGGSFSPLRQARQGRDAKDNIGHFFLAIDPKAFRLPGLFEADVDDIVDALHGTKRAAPEVPVQIPGEPELAARAERAIAGIPIPDDLMQQLRAIATRAAVPFSIDVQ